MTFNIIYYIINKNNEKFIMLERLEKELYILTNQIEYYGENYEDYKEELDRLERKISLLKKMDKF